MRPEPITEYAEEYSGGSMLVWNTEPYIERIYPLADQIIHAQHHGSTVYRRTVLVVEDWTEVEVSDQKCSSDGCLTCARAPRRAS